jgi:protein-tyrosine phosphatase
VVPAHFGNTNWSHPITQEQHDDVSVRTVGWVNLLFVCAGNVCRSPLAEGLMTAWAQSGGVHGAPTIEIGSAGIEAAVGREMDPASAAALAQLGGRPPARPAKALTAQHAADADLILTMTRRQRRVVLELSPRGLRRTFTLLEAADLIRTADLSGLAELSPPQRATELAARLDAGRALRPSGRHDDIEDPIGRSAGVHTRVARTIAEALYPMAATLLGSPALSTAVQSGSATNGP